jgi:hypothetical protein
VVSNISSCYTLVFVFSTQRDRTGTGQEYLEQLLEHSQTSARNSIFPGDHLHNLSLFLKDEQDSPESACRLYVCRTGSHPKAKIVQKFPDDLEETFHSNSLLFLTGYQSPSWLKDLGGFFRIDPEFFGRHISYIGKANDYEIAASGPTFVLPSSTRTMFRTSVTTLGQQGPSSSKSLNSKRAEARDYMEKYLSEVGPSQGWRPGHSIVQSYTPLDPEWFSIEQALSFYLVRSRGSGHWTSKESAQLNRLLLTTSPVIIWCDAGCDLSNRPQDPWVHPSSTLMTIFSPIALYKPDIAFKPHAIPARDTSSTRAGVHEREDGLPQSILLLPRNYGRSLMPSLMSRDPFYCLLELLAIFVASECKILNFIDSKVTAYVDSIDDEKLATTSNAQNQLMFFQHLLEHHVRKVFELSSFVADNISGKTHWTIVDDDADISDPKQRLAKDLDYLLRAMDSLRERCSRELSTMMSLAGIRDGQRGFESNKRTFKVTVLAAVFVPLSFSCSIFGMNFVEFNIKSWGYAIWMSVSFVTCLVTLLALVGNDPIVWAFFRRPFGFAKNLVERFLLQHAGRTDAEMV